MKRVIKATEMENTFEKNVGYVLSNAKEILVKSKDEEKILETIERLKELGYVRNSVDIRTSIDDLRYSYFYSVEDAEENYAEDYTTKDYGKPYYVFCEELIYISDEYVDNILTAPSTDIVICFDYTTSTDWEPYFEEETYVVDIYTEPLCITTEEWLSAYDKTMKETGK